MRALITRTDRLGDVLLALPALEIARTGLPDFELTLLARSQPLQAIAPWLRERNITGVAFEPGWERLWEGPFQGALFLFEQPEVLAAGRKAGVPLRLGPLSKWKSFLTLTHPVRQGRSRADANEAEYNMALAEGFVRHLGRRVPPRPADLVIPPEEPAVARAEAALRALGFAGERDFLILHPGMGGSAANLSVESYLRLLGDLERETGLRSLLSQGPAEPDRLVVQAIRARRPELASLSGLGIGELREAFRRAALVIAPSTGPLHLAHLVGTRTLGIYSPVQSQRWERWAPWGGRGTSRVLAPRIACPAARHCLGERCPEYFCLDRMEWRGLILEIANGLREAREPR